MVLLDDFQGWIDHIFISQQVDLNSVYSPPIYTGDLEAGAKARRWVFLLLFFVLFVCVYFFQLILTI